MRRTADSQNDGRPEVSQAEIDEYYRQQANQQNVRREAEGSERLTDETNTNKITLNLKWTPRLP